MDTGVHHFGKSKKSVKLQNGYMNYNKSRASTDTVVRSIWVEYPFKEKPDSQSCEIVDNSAVLTSR